MEASIPEIKSAIYREISAPETQPRESAKIVLIKKDEDQAEIILAEIRSMLAEIIRDEGSVISVKVVSMQGNKER